MKATETIIEGWGGLEVEQVPEGWGGLGCGDGGSGC